MDAPAVAVEVHLSGGLPAFNIVGLAETEVKESRDRVRAALLNARFELPARRITVNLAPADLPKESGRFDLPIAIGILVASGQLPADRLDDFEYAGELSLSGALRPVRGALAMTHALARERARSNDRRRGFVLPSASAEEAALCEAADIRPAGSLLDVCAHLAGTTTIEPLRTRARAIVATGPDLADVKGQANAKRALEVAAAGAHGLLMVGPPGTGKSMLAMRLPGLLPPMAADEALESAAIASLTGGFAVERWRMRPFRAPHHTASGVALVGGGAVPRPGEISLAHHGVLFLDELPEFDRRVLDVLREPLEAGRITISRAARQAEFPARFQFVAAMNPCPCGDLGHPTRACRCAPDVVRRYRERLSGPLLDRIDLRISVPPIEQRELTGLARGETTAVVAARVASARTRALDRQGVPNGRLEGSALERHAQPDVAGRALLATASARLGWSARAYHRVLKVARTIADLQGGGTIGSAHVAEAIGYRRDV